MLVSPVWETAIRLTGITQPAVLTSRESALEQLDPSRYPQQEVRSGFRVRLTLRARSVLGARQFPAVAGLTLGLKIVTPYLRTT